MRTTPALTTLTHTQAAVLGLLARGEMSGYELWKDMERHVGRMWAPARSQVYAVLPRLVDEGLATRREVEQALRPDKHVYRITKTGRAAVEAWIAEPVDDEPRSVFLLKLFFAEHFAPEAVEGLVEERLAQARASLARLREIESEADGNPSFHGLLTLRHGLEHARATVRWAEAALRDLRRKGSR